MLRITAPEFLGSTWLVPRFSDLHDQYPDLQISLIMDDRILNLSMREADAAIRLYKPDQNDLMYSSLGKIGFHICGSRGYFKKHGEPKSAKDLQNHTLLGYPPNVPAPFEDPNWLFRKANVAMQNNPKLVQINSLYGIFEAVQNGVGLAVLPDYLIKNSKEIQTCLDSTTRPSVEMYFVYAEERKNSTRIKVLRDFLADKIQNSVL